MPRRTLPLRVHQLWDCIVQGNTNTGGTGSVLDLDKLVGIASDLHHISKDELEADLKSAVEDGLIKCEETKVKGAPVNVYSLPDPKFEDKGDHDWYCFQCHLGGDVVSCEDCPRVFHMDCLADDRKPQQDLFVCPPCHIKSTKAATEKLELKQKHLNVLLTYICDRIKEWQVPFLDKFDGTVWALATKRLAKEFWRLNYLVYVPMDMGIISEKASTGKYLSLEEFQVDCETLLHAVGCYFGPDLIKGTAIGASFQRDVMHDLKEIQLCYDCFRRSNEKDHPWWFCLPCHNHHEVVWAKQTGYPFWPAKVMKQDGNKYDVRYFGGNYERGLVDAKNILSMETTASQLKIRKTAAWNEAYDELQHFLNIQKDPNLIESLPDRTGNKGTLSGKAKKAKAKDMELAVTPKRRKVETSPEQKASGKARAVLSKGQASTSKSGKSTPASQSNGMSTLKKIATSKTPEAQGTAPDLQNFPDLGHRGKAPTGMLELFEEFDEELREANQMDGSENKSRPQDSSEKVTENVVSSSEPSGEPVPDEAKRFEFGEHVNMVLKKYKDLMNDKYVSDVSATKRKQWCYNCEREAIYHCCWNTAYCSTGCQQYHWTKEHKRLCRRIKRDRQGYALANQPRHDDY